MCETKAMLVSPLYVIIDGRYGFATVRVGTTRVEIRPTIVGYNRVEAVAKRREMVREVHATAIRSINDWLRLMRAAFSENGIDISLWGNTQGRPMHSLFYPVVERAFFNDSQAQ